VRAGRAPVDDATVRRIVSPLRACLATAVQENVIPHNPTVGMALPHRPRVEDDDEDDEVRVLTAEQLAGFLLVVDSRHRPLFLLLAATGLRISEAIALQWKHVKLDGSRPHVRVHRALVRGAYGPPKSRQGRRDVPIPFDVVRTLRAARSASEWAGDGDLVFPNQRGRPLSPANLTRRTLKPAAEEAGVPWAGFHTFRHTCASMLFQRGANAVQVQRWLGHHSPAFTLSTYVHLLDEHVGEPLEIPQGDNKVTTDPTALDRIS
jgi:integrase